MSQSAPFLAIGALLLCFLAFWAWRNARPASGRIKLAEAQEALTVLQLELLSRASVGQIFSLQDWSFVRSQTPPRVQQMFLQERKTLALIWLRRTRGQVARLMAFHLKAARGNTDLSPVGEIKLAVNYASFLLLCGILQSLIWAHGPFYAREAVDRAFVLAEQLCSLSRRLMPGEDAGNIGAVERTRPGGQQPTRFLL